MDAARVLEDETDATTLSVDAAHTRYDQNEPEPEPGRALLLPSSGRPFTLDDLRRFPDDVPYRFELQDGCLIVLPAPSSRHQDVCGELFVQLRDAVPHGWKAILAPGFDPEQGRYREPDIAVCTREAAMRMKSEYPEPDELLLMAEVVSPSTETTDRVTKPAEYAAQGVEFYLRVELNKTGRIVRLFLFRNEEGEYVSAGETKTGGDPLPLPEPFTGAIDPSEL